MTETENPDPVQGWFHCHHCGALYRDALGDDRGGVCSECSSPNAGAAAVESSPASPDTVRRRVRKKRRRSASDSDGFSSKGSSRKKRRSRAGRRRSRIIAIASLVWVVLLVTTGIFIRQFFTEKVVDLQGEEMFKTDMPVEAIPILKNHGMDIAKDFAAFMGETNPVARAGFSLRSQQTAARMTHAQSMTSELSYTGNPDLLDRGAVKTPAGIAIETFWALDETRKVEAVFLPEDNRWKLDWEDYVRYSPDPWPQFLAGSGKGEGEFRLLARQRVNTGNLRDSEMGIVLSMPKFGHPDETSNASPPIVVDRDSDIGIRLLAAFDLRKKGLGAFGSHMVKHDPEDQIRVRVKVSRGGDEDRKIFRIEELYACHWLELDDAGNPVK